MIAPGPTAAALSPFAILWPVFALVLLILGVWATLLVQRLRHIRANPPTPQDFRSGSEARRYFEPVELPANNLANLFEMPVLFFALAPLLLMFRQVTVAQLMLAWIFVALRVAHSLVHIRGRNVRARFQVYLASVAVLSAMWVGFGVDAYRAARLHDIHAGVLAQL